MVNESKSLMNRYPGNPIVYPGSPEWRQVVTFNPGVIFSRGKFFMLERACSSLAPLKCQVGLLSSDDGYNFRHVVDKPVFTPEQMGTPYGTIEDPRVVEIDHMYYMTFVHRNFASSCHPNGVGVPLYTEAENVPEGDPNTYRSGIAKSRDLIDWEVISLFSPADIHERDDILFPEKINGRYAMLRRPDDYVGPEYGCDVPSIWISYSDDLIQWDDPVLVATSAYKWESKKIGAATPPLKTKDGWLALHHGVDENSRYRVGALLLDLEDPTKVLARSELPIMEPETYYEKVGLIIPNVVFPTAAVEKDGTVFIYYGCADTCISVCTARLDELLGSLS